MQRRLLDLVLWAVLSAGVFLPSDVGLPLWAQLSAVALLGAAVLVGRRFPVLAAGVPAAMGFAVTPELFVDSFMVAQLLLAFLLGKRSSRVRTGLLFFGAVAVTGLILGGGISMLATAFLQILLPWLVGRYARQNDQLARAGWQLAERLEREQALTALVERSRIAGDMHDSLGHELTLVALRAAALQVAPGLDADARRAAAELREEAAQATEKLREIIGVLRQDGEAPPVAPVGDTIAALVAQAAASGIAVTLSGRLSALPPMADRAAYRVVQEGLTNATKHAPGSAVSVLLEMTSAEAMITVRNSPAGSLPYTAGGNGLAGLRERVRLAGGQLRAGPLSSGGGFEVVARLPLVAAAGTISAREAFVLARRRMRRGVIDAASVPVVTLGVLLVLNFGYHLSN